MLVVSLVLVLTECEKPSKLRTAKTMVISLQRMEQLVALLVHYQVSAM